LVCGPTGCILTVGLYFQVIFNQRNFITKAIVASFNSVGAGVCFTLGGTDSFQVNQGVLIRSTDADAVQGLFNFTSVSNAGVIVGDVDGVHLGGTGTT
jgi:hypothetical protein